MVISVLERRDAIGTGRSSEASQDIIRGQVPTGAVILSALGGIGGVLLRIIVTKNDAKIQGWRSVVPAWATLIGFGATLIIGAVAGLYSAMRAARLSLSEALSTP